MAPKAKASAPAHLVITGRVKGAPKISQDGSAVVVKKTLHDGATVEEKFPKHRVRGKQRQLKQLIPAEEVLRTIEEATEAVASAARAEGERKLSGLQDLANRVVDQKVSEEKARTRFQMGKTVAAKRAKKALQGAADTYLRQRNEARRMAVESLNQTERALTAVDAIRARYNE
jgi:hypothetical protein